MIRRPSLLSAGLGVVALTLTSLVIGRVSADEGTAPADFTPVVITSPTPSPTPKPTPKPAPTPKETVPAPQPVVTNEPFVQVTPKPRDIGDDRGDDHGGDRHRNRGGDHGGDGNKDGHGGHDHSDDD